MLRVASRARWWSAFAAYSLVAIVMTWPLVTRITAVFPNDPGDPVLNTWILWWNAHHVPLTTQWWNGPFFWPAEGTLALSEHLLGLSLIATPLQWLGADPVTAYNIIFLISFPLSALAAHALTYTLTGRHDAGVVAGLVFGFNPYRVAQMAHIQVLASWWLPLAMIGLHQYATRREARWLWLYGTSWLLAALSNGYYMLFFPLLVALWMFWFARDRTVFAALLAASVAATLPLLPIVWHYRQVHLALGMHRDFSEILSFSPDVMGIFDASEFLKFWHLRQFHKAEGELFPGLVAVLLVSIPMIGGLWRRLRHFDSSRAAAILLAIGLVGIAAGLSVLAIGPWTIAIGERTLVSVTVIKKPITLGIVFLILAVLFDARVHEALHRRSNLLFYVFATLILYLLAFGPEPRLLGEPILYRVTPYEWLMKIPGFDTARVPSRIVMVALVALSAAAGLAFARVTDHLSSAARTTWAVLLCAGIIADGWIGTLPMPTRPPRIAALESLAPDTVVLELPMKEVFHQTAAMYRSMYHRHPLVNGYSGFSPKHTDILTEATDTGDPDVIATLTSATALAVALDTREDDGKWVRFFETSPGTTPLGRDGNFALFSVARSAKPAAREHGPALHVASIAATDHAAYTWMMTDGNLATRWDTKGPQVPGEFVTIDLGTVRSVDGLSLSLGAAFLDYPRDFTLERSTDAAAWSFVLLGARGLPLAVEASERDPRTMPLVATFAPVPARWLRIRQGGAHATRAWTIAELQVFGR